MGFAIPAGRILRVSLIHVIRQTRALRPELPLFQHRVRAPVLLRQLVPVGERSQHTGRDQPSGQYVDTPVALIGGLERDDKVFLLFKAAESVCMSISLVGASGLFRCFFFAAIREDDAGAGIMVVKTGWSSTG